jgi:hypothetical protein
MDQNVRRLDGLLAAREAREPVPGRAASFVGLVELASLALREAG